MNNSKDSWIKKNWLKLYFAFIILILIISSVGNVLDFAFYIKREKTEATVLEVVNKRIKSGARNQTSYKVTKVNIRYNIDGIEYNQEIKLQGRYNLRKGDTLRVAYNPKNPEMVIIPQKLYQGLRFEVLWGIFVAVQLVLVIKYGRKNTNMHDMHNSNEKLTNQANIA